MGVPELEPFTPTTPLMSGVPIQPFSPVGPSVSPMTPVTPAFPPTGTPNRFRLRKQRAAAFSEADSMNSDATVELPQRTADAASDALSDVQSNATWDAKSDLVSEKKQVTSVHSSGEARQTRRAFETMNVTMIIDSGNPLRKQLHFVDGKGFDRLVNLCGAHAWLLTVSSSHPNDVQPSFSENSVCIRSPDSRVSWVVASPSAEEQRSFLDRLCAAGCIVRDLQDHLKLLPPTADTAEVIRLGRPTSSRTRTKADIVALKVASDDEKMSQLLNEIQVLQNLHHDGIVGAYGVYEVKVEGKRSLGMVLDYKDGKDLSCWIPTGGLPECMVRGIMGDVCDALTYLHGIPVVHRDIKPSNVFCERAEDGSLKAVLADFGLAAHAMNKNKMSLRCGTGGFVAPEMFQHNWPVVSAEETVTNLTKIDVFSFGMTLYTIVFGKNPFLDTTLDSTYLRNARGLISFANMGGRSDELQSLLSGLCAKDPRERYSSPEALAHPWFSVEREGEGNPSKVAWAAFERAAQDGMMASHGSI